MDYFTAECENLGSEHLIQTAKTGGVKGGERPFKKQNQKMKIRFMRTRWGSTILRHIWSLLFNTSSTKTQFNL